jgi:hypothetical protein
MQQQTELSTYEQTLQTFEECLEIIQELKQEEQRGEYGN